MRKPLRLALLPFAMMAVAAVANDVSDYELKRDFIYNFAVYLDWPAIVGKSLVLCIAAPQAVIGEFEPLRGKPVGDMTITLRGLDRDDTPKGCHILFATDAAADKLNAWQPDLRSSQTLTIGESEEWLKQGAMIGLQMADRRVTFAVNADAAGAAGITINARLLRLARKVYGKEQADAGAN